MPCDVAVAASTVQCNSLRGESTKSDNKMSHRRTAGYIARPSVVGEKGLPESRCHMHPVGGDAVLGCDVGSTTSAAHPRCRVQSAGDS